MVVLALARPVDRTPIERRSIAAAIYLFNPVTWYDSAIWGQTDAVGALVTAARRRGPDPRQFRGRDRARGDRRAGQAAVRRRALPLVGVVLLQRPPVQAGIGPHPRPLHRRPQRLRGWFETSAARGAFWSAFVVAGSVCCRHALPFGLGPYEYLTVDRQDGRRLPVPDRQRLQPVGDHRLGRQRLAGVRRRLVTGHDPAARARSPASCIGAALLVVGFAVGLVPPSGATTAQHHPGRRGRAVGCGFFVLPTRVHERYMFPVFALLPILAVVSRRWALATLVFVDRLVHQPARDPDNATRMRHRQRREPAVRRPVPDDPVASALASSFRRRRVLFASGICVAACRPSAGRDGARRIRAGRCRLRRGRDVRARPTQERARGGRLRQPERCPLEPWYAPLAPRSSPSLLDPRATGARLTLIGEGGGQARPCATWRLRRLRRSFIRRAVPVVRTVSLPRECPNGMHFDEVYHARTAMEFLQDWRYGMPHSIYEYTHPHVAKYGMALGIEVLGNHRVTSTAQLSATTTDATHRTTLGPDRPADRPLRRPDVCRHGHGRRRLRPGAARAGTDRHDRRSIRAVAVDPGTHTLYAGQADGTICPAVDGWPRRAANQASSLRLEHPGGPIRDDDRARRAAGQAGRRSAIRWSVCHRAARGQHRSETGAENGSQHGRRCRGSDRRPAHAVVMVDPDQVTDRAALSHQLATLLKDDATRIEEVIATATGPVPVAGYAGDKKDAIQKQIDDGTLTGVSITDGTAVAVAEPTESRSSTPRRCPSSDVVASTDPVTGLVLAERVRTSRRSMRRPARSC